MTRKVLVGGLLVLGCAAAATAVPRVAHELQKPLTDVARLPERLWVQLFPPRIPKKARLAGLTGPEQEAVRELGRRLDGMLVWSSNRNGHHQLYLVDLRKQSVRQLTNTPNVNFFSRFSPDGRQIVFVRSQQEYVSFRDPTRWDVYLIDIDANGTGERRIAQGGYHPTWPADGRAIIARRRCSATTWR